MSLPAELYTLISAANSAVTFLRNTRPQLDLIRQKTESPREIVSDLDLAAERIIREAIFREFPGDTVWGEEGGVEKRDPDRVWVVDPIDGTVNFVRGFPYAATSIAFLENGIPKAAVVSHIFENKLYYASSGTGAFLNHLALKVPAAAPPHLFALAFGTSPDGLDAYEVMRGLSRQTAGVLRTGSAALNLCHVAEGQFVGACGVAVKYWDVAAGLLIAEEAGAIVKTLDVREGDTDSGLYGRLHHAVHAPGAEAVITSFLQTTGLDGVQTPC